MNQKTDQIRRLTNHLLNKYGSTNIIVTDYWDADNTAIGLTEKTKQFTVYISDYGKDDKKYFVALENPPVSIDSPYAPAGHFENLTEEEVERLLIKHLRLSQ